MNRRSFLRTASGATIAALGPRVGMAVAASDDVGLAGLDLPGVTVTVDDVGFAVPAGTTAGRVLMTVENAGANQLHFFAARVPDDVADEQLVAEMAADGEPAWFDMTKLTMLGNPDWPAPGGLAKGVVDLAAGRWLLLDPIDGRVPAIWTVSEAANRVSEPEPRAAVEVGLEEMAFAGLDGPLAAGAQVWKITNRGALEHEIAILPVAAGTTETMFTEQIAGMLQGERDGGFWTPVGGQGIASRGVTSWQEFDLTAGTYAAVCMTPSARDDPADFLPHALMGMVRIFTVQ